MISESENHLQNLQTELDKANTYITHLEKKIEFRRYGGSAVGRFTSELIKAKNNRDKIASDINRRGGDLTETNDLIKYALEVKEKSESIEKSTKELDEKLKAFSLYIDILTKQRPKKVFPEMTPRPVFTEIGIEMKKERNVEGVLKNAQKLFDQAKQKSENTSPVGKSDRTRQLTIARNALKLAKLDVERLPSLIEWYELRAEARWLDKVNIEKEEQVLEKQAYITELEAEFALLEKHGFIKTKS